MTNRMHSATGGGPEQRPAMPAQPLMPDNRGTSGPSTSPLAEPGTAVVRRTPPAAHARRPQSAMRLPEAETRAATGANTQPAATQQAQEVAFHSGAKKDEPPQAVITKPGILDRVFSPKDPKEVEGKDGRRDWEIPKGPGRPARRGELYWADEQQMGDATVVEFVPKSSKYPDGLRVLGKDEKGALGLSMIRFAEGADEEKNKP